MKLKYLKRVLREHGYYLKRKRGRFNICDNLEPVGFVFGEITVDRENNWDGYVVVSSTPYESMMSAHLNKVITPLWRLNV